MRALSFPLEYSANMNRKILSAAFVCAVLTVPLATNAAVISKPFEVSGWIPYWRTATGTAEVLGKFETFTEINPFGYTVDENGNLYDAASILQEPWTTVQAEAKKKGVRYIPTVMWANGEAIHAVLSDPKKRAAHIKQIVDEVDTHDFDGIDIDYEAKLAETKPHFSAFLKELYANMGDKWVQCTIESRTPLADRYYGTEAPKDAGMYANDFAAIAKYCDRVRIMAYDQQSIDLKLNASTKDPYSPVADPQWVEKVVKEAAKTIPKRKIVIGVPTYGYEYDVRAYADGYVYDLLWSFNPRYATELAAEYNVSPLRNAAGEMSFTYFPKDGALSLPRPASPWPGNLAAMASSALATAQNTNLGFRMVWWSDAQAISDKVALAKKLGIRGVAVFKIDGGQDPNIWGVLK